MMPEKLSALIAAGHLQRGVREKVLSSLRLLHFPLGSLNASHQYFISGHDVLSAVAIRVNKSGLHANQW